MRPARGRAHGKIRQEGTNIRFAGAFLIGAIALAGCGAAGPLPTSDKSPAKQKDDNNNVIYAQAGDASGWSKEAPKKQLWKLYWQSATVIFLTGGDTKTKAKDASGSFFQDGKEASQFKAATAQAQKLSQDVDADGQVQVTSLDYKSILRCDHIHYTSKDKLVQATGNVSVTGQWGTVSGLNEVWSTPDLKTFGTPDLFRKQ